MTEQEGDAKEALVKKLTTQLGEHFDSVQIFVSLAVEGGDTFMLSYGEGNWCAREGQVRTWVKKQDARIAHEVQGEDDDD